jgi:DNA-binding LacI/PurR family transcriptional regulator
MAHGAMNALLDSGLKVPEDVSILGFDDLPLAERIRPKLSTIHQPLDLFVSEILNYFSIPVLQEKGREILLKHSLVMRESCMALTEQGGKNE